MATTTPPAPIFPQQQQQGSFAAYSNPSRAIDTSSEEIAKGGRKMQQSMEDLGCLLYTSPSPRDRQKSRMPSSA